MSTGTVRVGSYFLSEKVTVVFNLPALDVPTFHRHRTKFLRGSSQELSV